MEAATVVHPITVGEYQTNSYLIYKEGAAECAVVDPGFCSDELIDEILGLGLTPKWVLLTHGHCDHIAGVPALIARFGVRTFAHKAEAELLARPEWNLTLFAGPPVRLDAIDQFLADGDPVTLFGEAWTCLHTPGHTGGSCCFLSNGRLLAGDTLFAGAFGRTDLPTGDTAQLAASVRDRLFTLPDATFVYPGHGPGTTIGEERADNPVATLFQATHA